MKIIRQRTVRHVVEGCMHVIVTMTTCSVCGKDDFMFFVYILMLKYPVTLQIISKISGVYQYCPNINIFFIDKMSNSDVHRGV